MSDTRQYRIEHGLCPQCGEEAAPYYLCTTHRKIGSVHRTMSLMAERGIIKKEKEGGQVYWSIPYGWNGPSLDNFNWGETLFDMDSDDKRLRPRLGRRPVDLDETLIGIFEHADRRLSLDEIVVAWGKLRSQRKTESLAGDMTALIEAQRRRQERDAKRAAIVHRTEGVAA